MIPEKITVEVWGDFTCVHCFSAKANFDLALSKFQHSSRVAVIWKSFELAPNLIVDHSKNMYEFLAQYNGATIEQVKAVCEKIADAGKGMELDFNFDVAVPANSFLAHQFCRLAADYNLQDKAKDALFKAHFTNGLDIDDIDVLREIAASIGMNTSDMDALLTQRKYSEQVMKDQDDAQKKGIRAVPYYLINSTHSISGAKDSAVYLAALEKAYLDLNPQTDDESGGTCEIGKSC